MGINGLLQQLKSISKPKHVSAYRGQKVAIDGYSWLHKGAYSCSRELCEGIWADGYVRYFVGRVELLLGNGVVPIVVFDGCRLPMKADEEDNRRRGRREALERARAHAESGNMAAATECYQRAVNITPWMAKVVIEALRERGVRCLVAPYEADAQMSYLALRGEVHAVLTEDSDMLAYGCPRVLYKLDRAGHGEEVLLADLPLVRELNMAGFDHDMLLQMCILAGCDFLPNISGVGIKKAHGLIKKHRDFVRVVRTLRFNGTTVPPHYEVRFQRTLWLFRHQRVFCPAARSMAHLRPLPPGGLGGADVLVAAALPAEGPEREALAFLGPLMEAEVAAGIADGELDPSTLKPFDLVAIYRGCPHLPRHLWAALGIPASGPQHHSLHHRGHGHGYAHGHGSATPASSQGGVPSSSQAAAAGGSQGHGGGGSSSQGAGHLYHSQQQQRRHTWGGGGSQAAGSHAPQHPTQLGTGQRRLSAAGGHGGKPPPAPNGGGIQRFFKSNPAASQPFRPVLPGAAAGGASQGRVSSDGEGSAPAAVVTLTGQRVQVVPCAAQRPAGPGAAASAAAAGQRAQGRSAAAQGAGDGEAAAVSEGAEDEGGTASLGDDAVAAALGACGAADGYEAADEEQVDTKRSTPNGKRRRRSSGHMRTAAGVSGGGAAGMPAPSPGLLDTVSGGSLFARLRCGGGRTSDSAATGGRGGPRPPLSSMAAAAVGHAEGTEGPAPGAAAVAGSAAGRLLRVPPAAESALEGSASGLVSNFQSQGRSQAVSGAESEGAAGAGSGYDSQYDSQATVGGGSEAAASAGGGGSLLGGWGGRRCSNRARAPAYLAMEALFSQPSDNDLPASQQQQQQPAGSGPAHSLGMLRPGAGVGALPGLDIWRRPPPGGTTSMSQPCMSLPSTSKHSHLTPSPEELGGTAAGQEDSTAVAGGAGAAAPAAAASAAAAAPCTGAASGAGAAHSSMPQPHSQAPLFSIYDVLEDEEEQLEHSGGRGQGAEAGDGGAAGKCTAAGQEEDEAGEEVTSPWKGGIAALGSQRPVMAGLRRRRPGGGGLLHPSARRRLNQEEEEEAAAAATASLDAGLCGGEEAGSGEEAKLFDKFAHGRRAIAGRRPARAAPQEACTGRNWLRAAAADEEEHQLFAGLAAARPQQPQQTDAGDARLGGGTDGSAANLFAFVGEEELELGRMAGCDANEDAGDHSGDADAARLFQALDRKEADRQSLLAELQEAQQDAQQQGCDAGPVGAGGASGGGGSGGRARRRLLDGFAHAQQQPEAEDASGPADEEAVAAPPGNTTPFGAYAASAGIAAAAAAHRQGRHSDPLPNRNVGARCVDPGGEAAAAAVEVHAAADNRAVASGSPAIEGQEEEQEQEDDEDDVLITQEVAGIGAGGGGAAGFHSVQHVEKFAHLARRAVDRLQMALQPPAATAAAAAAAAAAVAAAVAAAAAAAPRRPQQQPQQGLRRLSQPSAGAAPSGATPRPFGDFTCTRAAPKRRGSASGTKPGSAPAKGLGSFYGSIFVTDQGQDAPQLPQQQQAQAQVQVQVHGRPGEERAADEGGDADDDGDVEIVGTKHTPAMFNRRALAEMHLRRPFQVPRTINATASQQASGGRGAAGRGGGGGGGSAVGLTGGGRAAGAGRTGSVGGGARTSLDGAGVSKEARQAPPAGGAMGLQRFMCGAGGGGGGSRRATE
ncbi:hypothetical protein HYH02_012409 [Chlamydomonas schloesseri]|uniref:Exonuclease 1 n=1 Tax=Chlamydomonas schloesseri TaxID=2026947 RepID=A0A835VYW2_9CHLO|nr:hypothetical protein HYH02_012409 [Chlamydomonas schloesseri]|eukprot:KAG2434397.1 hypothetical protein HYH02_012409 [Chlamydomonas schloesseri]